VEGTVQGIVAGRCFVQLDDGGLATVWPELVAPHVPAERLFVPGMPLRGRLDPETNVLDVTPMLEARDPGVGPDEIVLGQVLRVARDTCAVTLVPGTTVTVSPFDATGDASADLRELLSEGEVVALELRERRDGRLVARIVGDVPLEEVPAVSILPGGPPWLAPPEPLAPGEPIGDDEAAEGSDEERPSTGDAALDSAQIENEQLRRRLANLERKLQRVARERDDARSSARAAKQRASAAQRQASAEHGDRLPVGQLFEDPEETFRFRAYVAWATRTTAADKRQYPWRDFGVGTSFVESLAAVEGVEDDRVAEVAADVICGRADGMHVYEVHQLRTGPAGDDPPVVRDGGQTCWRVALQRNTPAARRLHFWRRADGSVELSSVRVHDDFRP
jgi:hypothetical protein